jgi:hypothetical protein
VVFAPFDKVFEEGGFFGSVSASKTSDIQGPPPSHIIQLISGQKGPGNLRPSGSSRDHPHPGEAGIVKE